MLLEEWLHRLLRAANYCALLGLFGLLAFPIKGLRGFDLPRPPFAIMALAWFAPILSLLLMLVSIAAMMGQSLIEIEGSVIQAMIIDTHIGWAFMLRLLSLIFAALFLTKWPFASALLYALALATLAWSGHAAASDGAIGIFHRLNDALHLLAAGLWIGAIGWFTYLAVQAHRGLASGTALLREMHHFKRYGIALVALVSFTGMMNAQLIFRLDKSGAVLTMPYGQLLAAKVILVGIMQALPVLRSTRQQTHRQHWPQYAAV
jgi:copper resistance protein D